jgi:hypothetical protein
MKLSRLVLGIALFTAPAAFGDEPVGDGNAALQYWQAFGGDERLLVPDDLNAAKLAGDFLQYSMRDGNPRMEFFHAGAAMQRCDWGVDFRKGPETLLPHLSISRDLARYVSLRAQYRFEQGRYRDGVDDALALFELAKDVGETPVLVCLYVGYCTDLMAINDLATSLPKMDRATLDHLAKALEPLPAEDSLRRVWGHESKYFMDWTLERLDKLHKESAGDEVKWAEGLRDLGSKRMFADNADNLKRVSADGIPTYAKLRETLQSLKGLLVELEKATDLPTAEQDARLKEIQQPFQSDPLAKLLLPDPNKIFMNRREWQTKHALLDAAVAVARDGEQALKDKRYADPFGDGAPFAYRKTDKGFELQSKLIYKGKPVILAAGK